MSPTAIAPIAIPAVAPAEREEEEDVSDGAGVPVARHVVSVLLINPSLHRHEPSATHTELEPHERQRQLESPSALPVTHCMHDVDPVVFWYVPITHRGQIATPVAGLNVPTGQAEQEPAPPVDP